MLERILEPEVMDGVDEADAYDAMDHSEPNRAFVQRLTELGIKQCKTALDLGTGPGDIPIMLCGQVEGLQVTAVDLAQTMLDIAEDKLAEADLATRVALACMDVKALDLPDDSFDAVFSNTILHHIPEPSLMLAEASRVLKPGGLVLIRDLYRPETIEQLQALVAEHAAECDDEQRKLFGDSLHASVTPEELREMASANGFEHAEVVVDTDRHMSLQFKLPG